jgi:hypothetical protein
MLNGNWNKPNIDNKKQHIENIKKELFLLENGYWLKTYDKNKSDYPNIVLSKKENPPKFDNVDYFLSEKKEFLIIVNKNDNNVINYNYTKIDIIEGEIQIRINSLKSIIYLFENL